MEIISFGYLLGAPPWNNADLLLDVREDLYNPASDNPWMKGMTGKDAVIRSRVVGAPGAVELLTGIRDAVKGKLAAMRTRDTTNRPVKVLIGCSRGHVRSVAFAEELCMELALGGFSVTVKHRDLSSQAAVRTSSAPR